MSFAVRRISNNMSVWCSKLKCLKAPIVRFWSPNSAFVSEVPLSLAVILLPGIRKLLHPLAEIMNVVKITLPDFTEADLRSLSSYLGTEKMDNSVTLNLANFLSYYSANREIVVSSSICITPKSKKKKKLSVLKTDGKPVECSACKKPFPNKSSSVSHLSNSHGNQRR